MKGSVLLRGLFESDPHDSEARAPPCVGGLTETNVSSSPASSSLCWGKRNATRRRSVDRARLTSTGATRSRARLFAVGLFVGARGDDVWVSFRRQMMALARTTGEKRRRRPASYKARLPPPPVKGTGADLSASLTAQVIGGPPPRGGGDATRAVARRLCFYVRV